VVGPVDGETPLIAGCGERYVNACASVADWLSLFVTHVDLPRACRGSGRRDRRRTTTETFVADVPPT